MGQKYETRTRREDNEKEAFSHVSRPFTCNNTVQLHTSVYALSQVILYNANPACVWVLHLSGPVTGGPLLLGRAKSAFSYLLSCLTLNTANCLHCKTGSTLGSLPPCSVSRADG